MPSRLSSVESLQIKQSGDRWQTFEEVLQQLHQSGIYLHPDQLAHFLLAHGLPVDLRYVPDQLKETAITINENYQGDMARLEEVVNPSWYVASLA